MQLSLRGALEGDRGQSRLAFCAESHVPFRGWRGSMVKYLVSRVLVYPTLTWVRVIVRRPVRHVSIYDSTRFDRALVRAARERNRGEQNLHARVCARA